MTDQTEDSLPLEVIADTPPKVRKFRPGRRWLLLLLIPAFLFAGAVIGLYFQPPALQKFYALTGLTPGAGSSSPIALPPEIQLPKDMVETMRPSDVVALARLLPKGDISIIAAPYGAGDARLSEILVSVGDQVEKGDLVAKLDNEEQLKSAVLLAEANLAVREANLAQTRAAVENSRAEAEATLDQARAAETEATTALTRTTELAGRGVVTQANLDATAAAAAQAAAAVTKAEATLSRFTATETEAQPDVIVATRNLAAAQADLTRTRNDLSRAHVVAPIAGTILDIRATPGQRPPTDGIMDMGNTKKMMAEAEIYQDRIALITPGQPVELASMALGVTLQGKVASLGLTVGRQGLLSDDTAANTDARVVKVLIELDPASSEIAARYTNLQVIARIDTHADPAQP